MDQEQIIQEFASRVVKKFRPQAIILFGSRARGDHLLHSNYDFIILSDHFAGMPWLDRISAIVKLWATNERIDVIPYALEEFEDRKINSSTIRNALKDAKLVYGKMPSMKESVNPA